jgi:hypothetical protein
MLDELVNQMVAARAAFFAANEKAIEVWVAKTLVPREDRKRSASTTPEASPKRTAYAPTSHMPGTEERITRSSGRTAAKMRERGGVTTANTTAQTLYDKVLRSPFQADKMPLVLDIFGYVKEASPLAVEDPKKRTINFHKVDPDIARNVLNTITSHERRTWIPREKLTSPTVAGKIDEVKEKLRQCQRVSKLRGKEFKEEYEKLKWGKHALVDEEDYEEWTDSDSDDDVVWDDDLGERVAAMMGKK